jgi:putative copper resistance protein D
LDELLVWARSIHFAAAISVAGALLFLSLIAEPAFRKLDNAGRIPARTRSGVGWIAWSSLAVVVLSGASWLVLKAAEMGDVPWQQAFSEDLVPMVLWGTDFGQDWIVRLILAALLALALMAARPARPFYRPALIAACVLSAALVGTLAWAGHAAATTDGLGAAHIVSDFLHLVASAAWVGALVPLALLLSMALTRADATSLAVAREVVERFSTIGIVSVCGLMVTGIVNTWAILDGPAALVGTEYGRLLVLKIALFLAMLSLAAVNRLRLTPVLRQKPSASAAAGALRRIRANTLLEAALGIAVVAVVGLLGTLSPGAP